MTQKWYEKNVAIILFLIFFFPVGLLLMWKYSSWNKAVKIVISLFIGLAVIVNFSSKDKTVKANKDTTVQEQSKEEDKEENKEEITEELTKIEDRFTLSASPNTSAAVDELVLRAKKDAQDSTDSEIKEAVKFINDNYNNYWIDNITMEKTIYYGTLMDYSIRNDDIKNLGRDSVQVVKYIYRKAEKIEDESTQSNLRQIKKLLDNISKDLK